MVKCKTCVGVLAALLAFMVYFMFSGCGTRLTVNQPTVREPVRATDAFKLKTPPKDAAKAKSYRIIKVIDGDTVKIDYNGIVESVRLIGVNAPEIHHSSKEVAAYGREAAAFAAKLLAGQRVRLTFDVARRDRYGRLLAYVYLDDGTFVNARLVKEGYAQVMTVPPNVKYQALFTALQKEARTSRRGLWSLARYRLENPPN